MADTDHKHHATQFLRELRQYVLNPLATAARILERERTEVTAEQDAFEAFAERLATIDPVMNRPVEMQSFPTVGHNPSADRMARVRTAYRETVMSLPHYDDVYRESMAENLAAECGRDLAAGVCAEPAVELTPTYKTTLQTAAIQAAQERQAFLDALNQEAHSIETVRAKLTDLVAQLDTTTVPKWYQETFAARLDHVARDRQETIQTRQSLPRIEDHALPEYLYQDEPWTYPVLTAVARVCETVDLE